MHDISQRKDDRRNAKWVSFHADRQSKWATRSLQKLNNLIVVPMGALQWERWARVCRLLQCSLCSLGTVLWCSCEWCTEAGRTSSKHLCLLCMSLKLQSFGLAWVDPGGKGVERAPEAHICSAWYLALPHARRNWTYGWPEDTPAILPVVQLSETDALAGKWPEVTGKN